MVAGFRFALGMSICLFAGCVSDHPEEKAPQPKPPEGLALAYDTTSGVVTVSWQASEDSGSSYFLTRTDSSDGRFYGSHLLFTAGTLVQDTLFRSSSLGVELKSTYSVQVVARSDMTTRSSSAAVQGLFPSPLHAQIGARAKVITNGAQAESLNTLIFHGQLASGLGIDSVAFSISKDGKRLASLPAGMTWIQKEPVLPAKNLNLSADLNLGLLVGTAEPAHYSLHVKVMAGRFTREDSVDFLVVPDEMLSMKTVSLGGQTHASLGSFLQIDSARAYAAAPAHASASRIDLVFLSNYLSSPWHAANTTDWVKQVLGEQAQATELRKMPDDFDALTTLFDLETAWALGSMIPEGRVPAAEGLEFLARNASGRLAALRIISINPAINGSVTLEMKSNWETP